MARAVKHGAAWRRIEEQCDAKARGRAFRTGLCKRHGSDSDPKAVPEERSPSGHSGKGRGGEGSCDEHCGGEARSGKAVPKAVFKRCAVNFTKRDLALEMAISEDCYLE